MEQLFKLAEEYFYRSHGETQEEKLNFLREFKFKKRYNFGWSGLDWDGNVPDEMITLWPTLSDESRLIIFYFANIEADHCNAAADRDY